MGTRGRKSAAQLAVAPTVVEIVPRPVAPMGLTDEQASEWDAVVARMPADWFPRETHGILAAYCRHVVASGRVAQLIAAQDRAESIDITEYDVLLRMQEREGRAMSALATRMRLTPQSSITAKISATAKRKAQGKKLWEV